MAPLLQRWRASRQGQSNESVLKFYINGQRYRVAIATNPQFKKERSATLGKNQIKDTDDGGLKKI